MRKGLLLTIAFVFTLATTSSVLAVNDGPDIGFIPDIVIGDATGGQTATNVFVFRQGLDLRQIITDKNGINTVKAAFAVNPQVGVDVYEPVLGIAGKSDVDAAAILDWFDNGVIADHKDILGVQPADVVDLQSVSELFPENASPVPTLFPDFDTDRTYGLGRYANTDMGDDAALVTLLVADSSGSTATRDFLVKLAAGEASRLENDTLFSTNSTMGMVDFGIFPFGSFNFSGGVGPILSSDFTDRFWLDGTAVPADEQYFGGFQGNINTNLGGAWLDGLHRVRWVISASAADIAGVPQVRSRVKAAGTSVSKSYLSSALLLNPTGFVGGDNLMKGMLNDNNISLPHYFYGGAEPTLLNSEGAIEVAIDVLDFDPNTNTEIVYVDHLYVDVMPHAAENPAVGEAQRLFFQSGPSFVLAGDPPILNGQWTNFSLKFFDPNNGGEIQFSKETTGLRMKHVKDSFNLFGFWTTKMAFSAPGDLVRVIMKITDNDPGDTTDRPTQRLRFLTGSSDVVSELETLTDGNLGQPTAAGRTYELYQEVVPPAPSFESFGAGFDLINIQTTATPGSQVTFYADSILTQIEMQKVLLPY